ncbi:hypothetical protein [Flectobacillus longus]|uniref:hypothetical protein n=1 Tax=Flectobacillus longus TaxID=2984207 RepID=UPI0024B6D685|nr:hypothetical protein [Flectobacillus longus]MDI9880560.1 hypothetical protein [Flectobacillus longus]
MIKLRQFQCIGVFIMAMFWNLLMSISSFAQVPCTPASITTEPVLANVCQGDIVTFDIMATGSITGYQWYRNGSMISGATSDSYTITAQTANNGDKFKVIVKSSCGDDTSEEVTLTVTSLPAISINPVGATKCVGETYTFNVTASNAGGYQWTLDDADISGATNSTHTIPSICDICDAGNYKVDVFGTGVCASQHVTSSGADLIVKIPVDITGNPNSQTVCEGTPVTFSATATGNITGYQWYKNGAILTGATSSTYSITAQTSMNGDKYTVVVKGICGDETSTEATLNVDAKPSISVNPVGATKCVGDTYTFSVTASNAGGYQWILNDADISGANNASHTIPSICNICDAGTYKVEVFGTGACASESVTSSPTSLVVKLPIDITSDPSSQTVCEGSSVTFSVTATGDVTGYQWYKNGAILTGATSSTYGITAQTSMNGDKYTVVVKGICGDETSTEATLNVSAKPSISVNPVGATKCVGDSYTFNVTASNAGGYQWIRNNVPISGATNASYSIASLCLSCGDAGNYKVNVYGTGACASNTITSSEVNLDLKSPISLAGTLSYPEVCEGSTVYLALSASGSITGFEWYKNGVLIDGQTSVMFNFTAQLADNGSKYSGKVIGYCNSVTTNEVTLSIKPLPAITTQIVGATKCEGESYTFSVSATNAGSYQWIKNDVNISGATGSSYTISNLCKSCNEGTYKVKVFGSGACGGRAARSILSDPANLVVNIPVSISSQPTEQNVCSGSTATFRVKAIGDITGFQWYKNGIAITGATDSTYSVVGGANGDKFKVEVKGLCGNVISNEVLINVTPTPIITQQPLTATKCVGESVTFSVTASNAGAYQWQFKGVNIVGATNASYTKNIDCADCDAGAYRVIVFGQGVCTSSSVNGDEALLTVNRPMVITQQPQEASVCVSTNATFSVNATGTITGYQWYKNGVKIDGATASTYTFSTLSFNDGEKYKVEITGPCGALMSNEVNLQVKTIVAPTISTNKPSGLCVGEQFILSATGCDGGIVHWFANNIEVAQGQTHTSSSTATFNAQCENLSCKSDLSNGITHVQYGQINVAAIAGRVTCFGDKDGAVEINPSGGAGAPFSIVWTNYNNNNFSRIVDLPAGLYNYTITDRIGCKVQGAVPVDRPSEPTGTASASDVVCFGQKNGKITLSGTSDYGGFQYVLNQATPVAFGGGATTVENLDKGSYTVKVIDAKGCTVLPNTTLQIQEPTQLKVTLQKTVRPKSFSSNDGAISVKISGGTQPYGVEWSLLPSTILNSNIQTTIAEDGINSQLSALGTGEYQVKATDKNLCNAILTQKIVAPDKISITSKIDSITCFGKADAKITLTVTGGVQLPTTPFYQVNWQRVVNGQAQTISSNTLDLSKLDKGTYQVTVLDSNGISEKQTFILGEPTQLVTSVRRTIANYCASTPLGEVQILATGGRSPYSYTWDKTSQTTASINKLASGVYVATVTDKSGCVTTVQATVQDSISRYKMTTSYQPSTCFGRCDALLKSTVEGGIAPYQYTWSGINSTIANPLNVCAGGTTQLMITDAKGCQIKSDNITMTSPDPRVIGLAVQVEVCPSKSFDLSASSVPWGKTYLWTYPDGKTQSTASIKADSLGTYTIQVLDENSCGGVQQIKVIPIKNINILFAMPSSAPVDKAVVAIDLTNPTPTTIAWEYPTSAKLVSQDAYSIKLTFPQVGKFKVKELATINNCVYTLTKEIQIIEKANDGSFPAPTATQPEMDFTIMGNPTSGNKVTLSIENVEKRAFDVSVQSATKGILYQKSYSENDSKSLVVEIPENETEQVYFITLTSGDKKITKKVLIYR